MNPALDTPAPGIRVRVYPASIPDAALDRLARYVNRRIVVRAPRFAAWLLDLITDEQARRLRAVRNDPREPTMPTLPLAWNDAEVGEALIVADVLYCAASEYHERRFLECVRTIVVALAAHRLKDHK